MKYRIIALDVDGTLLNDDHELTPRVRSAVRAAAGAGAEIVLCTGRGSTSALPVLEQLGLSGTLITHNGASVVDSATRRVLDSTTIKAEEAARYTDYCRLRGLHFDINTAFELYVEGELSEELASMYERVFARPIVWTPERGLPPETLKISICAAKEALDDVQEQWKSWEHSLQIVRSGDFFMDVQPYLASKGNALGKLARLRNVDPRDVLAIGNYYNDIGMLEFAGKGIAMANSPEEVRRAADETTLSNNEDGVAVALEKLLSVGSGAGLVR